jgi:hypothetical protein
MIPPLVVSSAAAASTSTRSARGFTLVAMVGFLGIGFLRCVARGHRFPCRMAGS